MFSTPDSDAYLTAEARARVGIDREVADRRQEIQHDKELITHR